MSKKKQVFEILDKKGVITDSQAFKIWGDEKGLYLVGAYVRMWHRLQKDRAFFKGKKIVGINKVHNRHLIQTNDCEEHQWYQCGKDFYDEYISLIELNE